MNDRSNARSRRRQVSALIACAALAMSACGDDEASDDADPTEPTEDATTDDGSAATSDAPDESNASSDDETGDDTIEASADGTEDEDAGGQAASDLDEAASADDAALENGEPAVCTPYFQVSAAFAGEPDPATLGALLDEVEATAPDDIADELTVMADSARTVLETGDFAVFQSPEFNNAVASAEAWMAGNCAFETTSEIVALDYRYEGQAEEYPAGRASFTLVNEGTEAHEIVILRKNDGVDLTLEELMALPESEAETMTTYVGAVFVGPPGATGNMVVDLTPGDYIAVCTIPVGTFVAEDGTVTEGTGDAHIMLGMSFEFTVT